MIRFSIVNEIKLVTVTELSGIIKFSEQHIYKLVQQGKIPHKRVAKSIRFDLDEIYAWMESSSKITSQ